MDVTTIHCIQCRAQPRAQPPIIKDMIEAQPIDLIGGTTILLPDDKKHNRLCKAAAQPLQVEAFTLNSNLVVSATSQ